MIRVITIEREYGCGGPEIAQKIADRLGWKLWDQSLTGEIAKLSNCDRSEVESREERVDPLYYRLFNQFCEGSFEGSLNVHRLKLLDADSILRITEPELVQRAASEGNCVICRQRIATFFARSRRHLAHLPLRPQGGERPLLSTGGLTEAEAEAGGRHC